MWLGIEDLRKETEVEYTFIIVDDFNLYHAKYPTSSYDSKMDPKQVVCTC